MNTRARIWLSGWVLLAGCVAPGLAHARPINPQGFEDCDDLVEDYPDQRGAYACYYAIARTSGHWIEGAFRLEELVARDPENPWIYFALGSIAADHVGPSAAEPYLRGTIERLDEDSPPKHVAIVYLDGAELARELGDAALAQHFAEEAENAARRADDPMLLGLVWSLQARHTMAAGDDRSAARSLAEAALEIWSPSPPYTGHVSVLTTLASLDELEENEAVARARWLELAQLARDNEDALGRITAEFRASVSSPPRAQERDAHESRLRRLATEAGEAGFPGLQVRIECDLTLTATGKRRIEFGRRCLEHRGDVEVAASFFAEYALAMTLARESPGSPEAAAIVREFEEGTQDELESGWTRPWASAAKLQLAARVGSVERVLELSGQHFEEVEFYRSRQDERATRAHVGSEVAGAYYLVASLLLERREYAQALDVVERARNGDRLTRLRELNVAGAAAHKAFASARPDSVLASLQAELEPDEALLSFHVAEFETDLDELEGGSWLTVVLANDVVAYPVGEERQLESAAAMLTGLLASRDDSMLDAGAALFSRLLAPALDRLPASVARLHIITDGALHRLPFEALRGSVGEQFLAERFDIDYAPSATAWLQWRNPGAKPQPGLLALALTHAGPNLIHPAQPKLRGNPLAPLPRAEDEARGAIARWTGPSTLLAGDMATESSLGSALENAGMIHFATHALIDEERPAASAIVLGADRADDGLLRPSEIDGMDFSGRVVVLSACQGAQGQALRGEGVLSLATAFTHAGAEAVVASRWPLHDTDAFAFFDRFYAHLAKGESIAAALRLTRQDRIAAGAPAQAWAGVIVLGNGDIRPLDPPGDQRWKWVVALCLVLAAAFVGLRIRSAQRKA